MAQKQNITENNTKTKTCLWFNRYYDCTGIGIKPVEGYTDLWLCQTCYDRIEADENRISQLNNLEENKQENK